jgi:glucose/arabinose dehydrogenase
MRRFAGSTAVRVIARRIRQVVGIYFDPTSKQLYFSENQRDWLSEELLNDKFNGITKSHSPL